MVTSNSMHSSHHSLPSSVHLFVYQSPSSTKTGSLRASMLATAWLLLISHWKARPKRLLKRLASDVAQRHLYVHDLGHHSTQHMNIATNVLLPVCSFGFLLPGSVCETNGRNRRQSNSVLNPHTGATLCSICDWAHREDDDNDDNDSTTKPDWGSQLPGSDTGCSDPKSMVWLPSFYRWENYNLEKLRLLSNVTQLIGCIVWLYLIKCPKDTWIK